jgi:hypothetical protein
LNQPGHSRAPGTSSKTLHDTVRKVRYDAVNVPSSMAGPTDFDLGWVLAVKMNKADLVPVKAAVVMALLGGIYAR